MTVPGPRQHRGDLPISLRTLGGILGPGLGLLAVFGLIAAQPGLVEELYATGAYPWISRVLMTLTGWLPISLAEWIEGGLIAAIVLIPLPALRAVWRRDRTLLNVAGRGLARLVVLVLLALIGFYASWGLNYARAPLLDRFGWPPPDPEHPMAVTELVWLADDLVDLANDRYVAIHGSEDAGTMTAAPDRATLDQGVEEGWSAAVGALGMRPELARRRPPAKPLLSSFLFSRMGISGFYFPYTAEANYNTWTPGWQLPLTIAHEKAHQRGFASENEANFAGFLACMHSSEPTVQYAGLLFAQRQLLFALLEVEPATAYALILRRHPGVQRDVDESKAFWRGMEGTARNLSHAVNDAYLRANRVRGGIDSYNQSTELILAFAAQRGLQLEPAPVAPQPAQP